MKRKSSSEIDGFPFPPPDVSDWPDTGVVLEIGSLLGRSAVVWAEAFEQAGKTYRIITVDSCMDQEFPATMKLDDGKARAMWDQMRQRGLVVSGKEKEKKIKENIAGWNNIHFIKASWNEKFEFNLEAKLTGVYYDARHDYEMTWKALEKYADVGWFYVDDCNHHFPGCQQACNEHVEKYNKKIEIIKNAYGMDQLAILTKR